VRDRNPMEVADDALGRRFGDYFRMADNSPKTSFLRFPEPL